MERLAWHLVHEQLTTTNQLTPVAPARKYSTVLTYYKCKGEMENGEWSEGKYHPHSKLVYSLLIEFAFEQEENSL